jgi:cell division protein ZapA
MAQVTVQVNGKPYIVGCEDGQEGHVQALAKLFDDYVEQVAREVGQLGETRLFLMGSLLLADELADLRARLAQAEGEVARRQADGAKSDLRAVAVLEGAAKTIEAMAAKA